MDKVMPAMSVRMVSGVRLSDDGTLSAKYSA